MCTNKSTIRQEALQTLLRQVRLEANLRQEDLAKCIDQVQSVISKYESGERRVDLVELSFICEAVGITLPEFIRRYVEAIRETE
jgi:transcriptional regulator with XRE-family HTH domain